MSRNKLIILVVAAVVALAGGWYFGTSTEPVEKSAIDSGRLMFPDLAAKLKDARRIEITNKGKTTVIEDNNGVWGVADRGGYPVQESKLRGMLTALTELRLTERRTSDPAEFTRLGLEDPTKETTGTANLLRVLDGKGEPILAVIVGHRRMRTQGNVPEEVYVRLPNDNQTWLADGSLQADVDPQAWLDRDIVNISHTLITKVVATKDGQTIELTRDGDKLKVTQPSEYPKLDDYKLEDVGRALENLTFQDVKPASEPIGDKIGDAVFSTSDGLEIAVAVYHQDQDSWTRINVTAPDRGKPEAERLNTKLSGWAFETGAWKDKSLVPSLDDLKAPPPAPAATPGAAAPGTLAPGMLTPGATSDTTTSGAATPGAATPGSATTSGTAPVGAATATPAPAAPTTSGPVAGETPTPATPAPTTQAPEASPSGQGTTTSAPANGTAAKP
jgi:hypothetical protein